MDEMDKVLEDVQTEQQMVFQSEQALLEGLLASLNECSTVIGTTLAMESDGAKVDTRCLAALEALSTDIGSEPTERKMKNTKSRHKNLQGKVAKLSKGLRSEFEMDTQWLERQQPDDQAKQFEEAIVLHLVRPPDRE